MTDDTRSADDYASLNNDLCTQQETNSPKRLTIVDDDTGEPYQIVSESTGSDGVEVRIRRKHERDERDAAHNETVLYQQ